MQHVRVVARRVLADHRDDDRRCLHDGLDAIDIIIIIHDVVIINIVVSYFRIGITDTAGKWWKRFERYDDELPCRVLDELFLFA